MIVLEGLIGVGKSTLSNNLGELLKYKVMKEPVEENPYLAKFYEDPKRYALEMQYWLLSHRFQMHQEAIEYIWRTGNGVIMDRSIYGDTVFARKNYLDGNISTVGYKSYIQMREVMKKFLMVPQVTIFLNANPEVCLERIKRRDRNCEMRISTDYLSGLNALYNELLLELEKMGSKVISVDWDNFLSPQDFLAKIAGLLPENFQSYPRIGRP